VLTLEWLSTLTAVAGPAGALRAVRHYEQIGWIGSTARRQIESLLASPSLDVFVDPTDPSEPTAGQHRQSYQYLVVLKTLREA
jgi:Putative archaeal flagellar protein D/E